MVTSSRRHLLTGLLLEGELSSIDSRNFFWQHGSYQDACMEAVRTQAFFMLTLCCRRHLAGLLKEHSLVEGGDLQVATWIKDEGFDTTIPSVMQVCTPHPCRGVTPPHPAYPLHKKGHPDTCQDLRACSGLARAGMQQPYEI